LLETESYQRGALGMILLGRRGAKHHQHLLAYHWMNGPAIRLRLALDQLIQRLDLLVQSIEGNLRTRSWSGTRGTA
jgi:hypothetical protein